MTVHAPPPTPRDEMTAERRAELLAVLPPDRLRSHIDALRAEIAALTGLPDPEEAGAGADAPAPGPLPLIGPGSVDWVGLGRQAHAAAGHAQLLGFRRIGLLLNALEAAAKDADRDAAESARCGLVRQLALGAPRAPEA